VYVCVYAYTRTHCTDEVLGCEPRGRDSAMRHLESPKNPDGLNLGTYIFVNMYKEHMCGEGPEGSSVMNPSP